MDATILSEYGSLTKGMPKNLCFFAVEDASISSVWKFELMRLIIRTMILSVLVLFSANHLCAQADLEVKSLVIPIPGSLIDTGITFDITFQVKNVGTVALLQTDTISVSLSIASTQIGSASFPPLNDIDPGQSYNFTINNVPSNVSGFNLPVCVTLEWDQDQSLNNNTLCEGYNFGAILASTDEPELPQQVFGVHYEHGQLGFNWSQKQGTTPTLRVYDMQGRTITEQGLAVSGHFEGRLQIGIPSLSSGIYFLGIYQEGFQPQIIRFSSN